MSVSRRSLLKGAATLGAAGAMPLAMNKANAQPRLAVVDSRLAEARIFARSASTRGLKVIDIASGDAALWHIARQDLSAPGKIIGMTGWSDWIVLRGLMEEQGKRVKREDRIAHRGSRIATPFEWAMA